MATIHLIEGPVGAGKSTFALRLGYERQAPWLDLDQWMVTLFRPDRPETGFLPWYAERKERCTCQIGEVAWEILDAGSDVVLELGLVGRAERADFYQRVDETDHDLVVHVLQTPEETRRQRVRQRNRGGGSSFRMVVSDEVFELANRAWEAPDETECREREIRVVHTEERPPTA